MRKNIEIPEEKMNEFLEQFYGYFEDGYIFEESLEVYLEKIGLDEVIVTQRLSDGSIDLEAIRYGVGGLAGAGPAEYYVQAKRNKPGISISIEKVRVLKGVMPSGSKGIFVTTAGYSKKAQESVNTNPPRPTILTDGKALVENCIDSETGFILTPVFSKDAINALKDLSDNLPQGKSDAIVSGDVKLIADKQMPANNIRTRILRLPKATANTLSEDTQKIRVVLSGLSEKELTIVKNRAYLAGVTDLYKESGLLTDDDSYNPCKAIRKYSGGRIEIVMKES